MRWRWNELAQRKASGVAGNGDAVSLALLRASATAKEEACDEMEEQGVTGGRWGG